MLAFTQHTQVFLVPSFLFLNTLQPKETAMRTF